MARTALFGRLRRIFARAQQGEASTCAGWSRRGFMQSVAALSLVPAIGCGDDDGSKKGGKRVAVVGGGIAGLTAAYFLKQAGITATVYEASMRPGGRMFTNRDTLMGGQICEMGGELVDSNHMIVPALCATFGLQIDDLVDATPGLAQDQFHFHGAFLAEADLVAAFGPIAAKMSMSITMGEADDAEFARIDALSIPQYLEQEAQLAAGSLFRDLLETSYTEEFGLEVEMQSAWNLLYLIDAETADPFRIFGDSDERFHIHNGSGALPEAIAADLGAQVVLDSKLTSVAAGDAYTLTFATAGGDESVTVDRVVYALPFTKLREVNLDAAGLSEDKRTIIDELGYGMNAKLMMQFTERHWATAHQSSGSLITDIGDLQTTWDTTRGQTGTMGVLTNFVGGDRGMAIAQGTPESQAQMALPWIDTAFPGTGATYIANSAIRQHWPSYEFTKGSYACYKLGQWSFFGFEGTAEGTQYFCGEHTSEDFQGYMEGGAESGARVAIEILTDLGIELPAALAAISGFVGSVGEDERVNPLRRRRANRLRRRAALRALVAHD